MTTYHTFDDLPTPSDLELAAADRAESRWLTFGQFTYDKADRERFHRWMAEEVGPIFSPEVDVDTWDFTAHMARVTEWNFYYAAFCQADDTRDLADTQADALR